MASKRKGGKNANLRNRFPAEVRAQAVAEMQAGESMAAIARKYGTSAQTPRNWLKAAGGTVAKSGARKGRRGRPAGSGARAVSAPAAASTSVSRDERLLNAIKNAIREYIADIQL